MSMFRVPLSICKLMLIYKSEQIDMQTPNPAVKRDCAKARSPLLLR
jgi:hypothetical protein